MRVVTLNHNNNITNIINGVEGGRNRDFILTDRDIERLSPIIRFAYKLESEQHKRTYIEVKFDSIYNQRPQRLEIVAVYDQYVEIYKFSNLNRIDHECSRLQRVIDELKRIYGCIFRGYIVLRNADFSNYQHFSLTIDERFKDISMYKEV